MKRFLVASLAVAVIILGFTSTAFAYDRVVGCAVDVNNDPWTWGGTVTCRQNFWPFVIVGQGTLDAGGCFEVFIGNGPAVTCTIQYNPGPAGQPDDDVCAVPRDTSYFPQPWPCGVINTDTGPNAITLAGFGATSSSAGAFALVLSAVIGGVALWRRRR